MDGAEVAVFEFSSILRDAREMLNEQFLLNFLACTVPRLSLEAYGNKPLMISLRSEALRYKRQIFENFVTRLPLNKIFRGTRGSEDKEKQEKDRGVSPKLANRDYR